MDEKHQYCVMTIDPRGNGSRKPIPWTIGKPLMTCMEIAGEWNLSNNGLTYSVGERDVGEWHDLKG